jgi:hypothetical protein
MHKLDTRYSSLLIEWTQISDCVCEVVYWLYLKRMCVLVVYCIYSYYRSEVSVLRCCLRVLVFLADDLIAYKII